MTRRGYLDTPGGQIHYRTAGDGEPLLLLHQSPSSSAMWEPVLPIFGAHGYRAIAPDTPGFGMSDVPPVKPDAAEYARRLLEFVDLLGIDTFFLFGHHTGAALGSLIAAEHPGRVRKLALYGYPMFSPADRARLAASTTPPFEDDGAFLVQMWNNRRRLSGPNLSPAVSVRLLIERLQAGELAHWGPNAVGGLDVEELPGRVTTPTLVVCGQRDTAWEQSNAAVSRFPNARFEVLDGTSMDVADEEPERLVEVVDSFFRES